MVKIGLIFLPSDTLGLRLQLYNHVRFKKYRLRVARQRFMKFSNSWFVKTDHAACLMPDILLGWPEPVTVSGFYESFGHFLTEIS